MHWLSFYWNVRPNCRAGSFLCQERCERITDKELLFLYQTCDERWNETFIHYVGKFSALEKERSSSDQSAIIIRGSEWYSKTGEIRWTPNHESSESGREPCTMSAVKCTRSVELPINNINAYTLYYFSKKFYDGHKTRIIAMIQ